MHFRLDLMPPNGQKVWNGVHALHFKTKAIFTKQIKIFVNNMLKQPMIILFYEKYNFKLTLIMLKNFVLSKQLLIADGPLNACYLS